MHNNQPITSGNSSSIRLLPQIIINRIAAGEVIERPASVVKELVENAIDAGAKNIEVTIENAGKSLIRVQDDGEGMNQEELELAVKRHATSKLPDDDLFNINFLGFRGEALPSIASIAKVKITTKQNNTNGDYLGFSKTIIGGVEQQIKPEKILSKGTIVEVHDLFFATPARLKFLKTERSENIKIHETFKKIAMVNPELNFRLVSDGRKIYDYKSLHELNLKNNSIEKSQETLNKQAIHRLDEILGNNFAENAVIVGSTREGMNISGFTSVPTYNKAKSTEQYLFVNNRPVRDKVFLGAIRAAYNDFLARDRFPVTALFITMPSSFVDVNVHPAKAEVRFRFENDVRALIISSVKSALTQAGFQASSTIANQAFRAFKAYDLPASERQNNRQNSLYNYENKLSKNLEQYPYEPTHRENYSIMSDKQSSQSDFTKPSFKDSSYYSINNSGKSNALDNNNFAPQNSRISDEDIYYSYENYNDSSKYPLGVATAQLHDTYIISQTQDAIIITDQHAAHERLVYEDMKIEFAKKEIARQILLIPEIIDLSTNQVEILLENIDKLEQFGFRLKKFGNNAVEINEIPNLLHKDSISNIIKDLADNFEEFGQEFVLSERFEHILETIACHYSIRSGRKMNINEMNALLRKMENTPHSGQCNHGRPTYVKLNIKEVEKLFGRR